MSTGVIRCNVFVIIVLFWGLLGFFGIIMKKAPPTWSGLPSWWGLSFGWLVVDHRMFIVVDIGGVSSLCIVYMFVGLLSNRFVYRLCYIVGGIGWLLYRWLLYRGC